MPRSRTRSAMSRIRFSLQDLAPLIVLTQNVLPSFAMRRDLSPDSEKRRELCGETER